MYVHMYVCMYVCMYVHVCITYSNYKLSHTNISQSSVSLIVKATQRNQGARLVDWLLLPESPAIASQLPLLDFHPKQHCLPQSQLHMTKHKYLKTSDGPGNEAKPTHM